MSTFTNTAREVEMPNGDIVKLHDGVTPNSTSNIKKFKYDDNGHVTESTAADAEDLNLSGYSTPTTGTTDIGASDDVQTAIGKLDHQSHIDQTNILYSLNTGVKNICNPYTWILGYYLKPEDGSLIPYPGDNGITSDFIPVDYSSEDYYYISGLQNDGNNLYNVIHAFNASKQFLGRTDGTLDTTRNVYESSFTGGTPVGTGDIAYIRITQYGTSGHVTNIDTSLVMVCTGHAKEQSVAHQPYALPNYDLTRLEAEDRAALAEVVDKGAKNLLDFANLQFQSQGGTTYTKTDTDITVTSSTVWANCTYKMTLPAGNYVFSAKISNLSIGSGGAAKICLDTQADGHGTRAETIAVAQNGTVSGAFTWGGGTLYIMYYPNYTATAITTTFKASENMICTEADWKISQNYAPFALPNTDLTRMMTPFFTVPINHNMIYRGQNLGETFTEAQDTALSSGNFTDLYLGDYWTKTVTIPAGTYTGGDGESVDIPAQTNITLKAVIADFDTFYAGYASGFAGIGTHHAAVIVTGFGDVVWNKTNSAAGGYVASLIHKWLVGSALPQIETWFSSDKVLSHQKLLTNAITGDAASGWAWSAQKIALLSENQLYGSKVWGGSKATNGAYEPGEASKHLNIFNHIDANLLFGNNNIWLRDIASAEMATVLSFAGNADRINSSSSGINPVAFILLS